MDQVSEDLAMEDLDLESQILEDMVQDPAKEDRDREIEKLEEQWALEELRVKVFNFCADRVHQ